MNGGSVDHEDTELKCFNSRLPFGRSLRLDGGQMLSISWQSHFRVVGDGRKACSARADAEGPSMASRAVACPGYAARVYLRLGIDRAGSL
jgi:hypothetical protein